MVVKVLLFVLPLLAFTSVLLEGQEQKARNNDVFSNEEVSNHGNHHNRIILNVLMGKIKIHTESCTKAESLTDLEQISVDQTET